MDTAGLSNRLAPPATYPRRFRWPMRFFLSFMVFWMIFRCVAVLLPMDGWAYRYDIQMLPKRLPTAAQREALRQSADPEAAFDLVSMACLQSAVDVLHFCNPIPSEETRDEIQTPLDGVRYAAVWLNTRLDFLEHLAGVHQEWIMFAPGVPTETVFLRARLYYDDNSERIVRQVAEPADLTHGGHGLFEERITDHENWAYAYQSSCWGYCNLLAHRYPKNDNGASVTWIVLMYASVARAPPGVDALAHYQEQNRLIATPPRIPNSYRSQVVFSRPTRIRDYYVYNVKTRGGKIID